MKKTKNSLELKLKTLRKRRAKTPLDDKGKSVWMTEKECDIHFLSGREKERERERERGAGKDKEREKKKDKEKSRKKKIKKIVTA